MYYVSCQTLLKALARLFKVDYDDVTTVDVTIASNEMDSSLLGFEVDGVQSETNPGKFINFQALRKPRLGCTFASRWVPFFRIIIVCIII